MLFQSKQPPKKLELIDEVQARNPWLERYGLFIVLGFSGGFALLVIALMLNGHTSGQSLLLKGSTDILQITGEWIGFGFCLDIALRLRSTTQTLKLTVMQLTSQSAPRAEVKSATATMRSANRAWLAWLCFSIGIACFGVARIFWTSYDIRMPALQMPSSGLYEIGYVVAYPFLFAGMILLARRGPSAIGRFKLLLDSLIVIGVALALSWFFLLGPSIERVTQSSSPFNSFLLIYFPTGDLLLVAVSAILLFVLMAHSMQPVLLRAGGGLICLAVADSLMRYYNLSNSFRSGTLLDLLWPLSLMLIGLAAVEYPRTVAREQERNTQDKATSKKGTTGRVSSFVLFVGSVLPFALALGTCALLFLVIAPRSRTDLLLVTLVSLVLVVIILLRQALTNLENVRLALRGRDEPLVKRLDPSTERKEGDTATLEAIGKSELQEGIRTLQRVHASVARGDLEARAPIDIGPLLPISQSLNLMLDRMNASMQRAKAYDQLIAETQALQILLDQLCQEVPVNAQPLNFPSIAEVQPVMQGIVRLQRVNADRLRRLSGSLDDMRSPLQHLHQWVSAGGKVPEPERAQLLTRINDLGSRWVNLREQTDSIMDLTERSVPTARFI